MRGQAFVVFMDLASSTAALRAMDGFIFYDNPLVSFDLLAFDLVRYYTLLNERFQFDRASIMQRESQ